MIPYLTGKLIIADDNDLYRITQLSGTERVKIILIDQNWNFAIT